MTGEILKKKRYFFALCRELGYDKIEAKERAKKRFRLDSFRDISLYQLNFLIAKLQAMKELKDHIF